MKAKMLVWAPLLAIAPLAVGCGSMKTSTGASTGAAANASSSAAKTPAGSVATLMAELPGNWTVESIDGKAVTATPDSETPYVSFSEQPDGSLLCAAFNGCNFTNMEITLGNTGGVKRKGEPTSTLKLCPDAQWEMPMTTALASMASLQTEGNLQGATKLLVKNGAGQTVMTLVRNTANFLDGAWQATRLAGLPVKKDNAPRVVIDIAAGAVHGRASCNTINGHIETGTDGAIRVYDVAATRMMCPDIEQERAFIGALEQSTTVKAESDGNKAVFKDAKGRTLLEMTRITREELEAAYE